MPGGVLSPGHLLKGGLCLFLLSLPISRMHFELAIEIIVSDIERLILSPPVNTHLLYQAKIENLSVVWSGICFVCIGVKIVAGKIRALITVCYAFLTRTTKHITWFFIA